MNPTARLYLCALCHRQVTICSTCDRGNIYCNSNCSRAARSRAVKDSSRRYQNTRAGMFKHALRQQQYRQRQTKRSKIVTHQGSIADKTCDLLNADKIEIQNASTEQAVQCHFCKKWYSEFLRNESLPRSAVKAVSKWPLGP